MPAPLATPLFSEPPTLNAAASRHEGLAGVPALDSSALLLGQKAVVIHHNGAVYRLQATRLGKLILTK